MNYLFPSLLLGGNNDQMRINHLKILADFSVFFLFPTVLIWILPILFPKYRNLPNENDENIDSNDDKVTVIPLVCYLF